MIRRQVVVPAPPEAVWGFLTAQHEAGPWLGGRMRWQAEQGGDLVFTGDDGIVRRGVVEAARPARYLSYRWWPEDADDGPATVVTYLLEAAGEETLLTVQETLVDRPDEEGGFAAGEGSAGGESAGAGSAGAGRPGGTTPPSASLSVGGSWTGADDRGFRIWARSHQLASLG